MTLLLCYTTNSCKLHLYNLDCQCRPNRCCLLKSCMFCLFFSLVFFVFKLCIEIHYNIVTKQKKILWRRRLSWVHNYQLGGLRMSNWIKLEAVQNWMDQGCPTASSWKLLRIDQAFFSLFQSQINFKNCSLIHHSRKTILNVLCIDEWLTLQLGIIQMLIFFCSQTF